MANPKVKGAFEIEEYAVIERVPKTENSFCILRVPKAVMIEVERRLRRVELEKEWKGNYYDDNGYASCQPDGKTRALSSFNQALTKMCERNGLPVIILI